MREEADLDALVTRIQSDLRAGRGPRHRPVAEREVRIRSRLKAIRGPSARGGLVARMAARWLVPAMIFGSVLAATLLFDRG